MFQPKHTIAPFTKRIAIGYALPIASLEPTLFDAVTRGRLVSVYEGLVRTDRNLKIQPAIAITWGLIDPLTWEFKLRPEVKFHNGKTLIPQDVIASIDRALHDPASQLTSLINTIEQVNIVDSNTIRIKTKRPDPLLLNKLSVVFIFPKDYGNFEQPVGTGPYLVSSNDKDKLVLKQFDLYYGPKPVFQEVVLQTILDKEDRIMALKNGAVQMLVDVPPAFIDQLKSDFIVKSVPSLEVNFLMFNLEDSVLKNKELRDVLRSAIDRNGFIDFAGGFARPVGQFVSSGVFGFNPKITNVVLDAVKAKKKVDQIYDSLLEPQKLTLDFPEGLEIIGQYLQGQVREFGLDLELNPLSNSALQDKILKGTSQFYYLGWRSELGDASDFLQAIAHSKDKNGLYGNFNGANYMNPMVDELIEASQYDLNPKTRLKNLQEVMRIIVEDDVIGIPLFEADTLFAFNKNIHFEPRVDGYIHAYEIN